MLGSQKVAGKSCIKTENSQVAVTGAIITSTYISCVIVYRLIQVRCCQETSHNENSLGNFLSPTHILYYTYQYTISPIYCTVYTYHYTISPICTIMNHRWQNWGNYRKTNVPHFYLSLHRIVLSSISSVLILYTRNFSRCVNFTDFAVSRAAVKIYSMKILLSLII